MRLLPVLFALTILASLTPPVMAAQHPHGSADRRAHDVMGFDQERTQHHFLLFTDGGSIDVTVKERTDENNRDAIRAHLHHVAAMFGRGDFEAPMLVHSTANVPGTATMAAKKAAIRYRYVETPDGGRVDIHTSDPDAVAAIHAFLKYQIVEHKTGDAMTPRPR